MTDDDWPKHPDGRKMKLGEMTSEQRRKVFTDVCAKLQAELDDPKSRFRQTIVGLLRSPDVPRTRQ
jgi:hypothetical protein